MYKKGDVAGERGGSSSKGTRVGSRLVPGGNLRICIIFRNFRKFLCIFSCVKCHLINILESTVIY